MKAILKKSNKPEKKYMITFSEKDKRDKTTHFGAADYRDYTLMNDKNSKYYEPDKNVREKVKQNYISRHKNDNLNDATSAGALSMFLLWNKPTIIKSISDYKKKFGVDISFKK